MATKDLINHPGYWLEAGAADSLARLERDHGVININSAGRTEGGQQGLINRWDAGGWQNRPPYLYEPARPARTSPHVIAFHITPPLNVHDGNQTVSTFVPVFRIIDDIHSSPSA